MEVGRAIGRLGDPGCMRTETKDLMTPRYQRLRMPSAKVVCADA